MMQFLKVNQSNLLFVVSLDGCNMTPTFFFLHFCQDPEPGDEDEAEKKDKNDTSQVKSPWLLQNL